MGDLTPAQREVLEALVRADVERHVMAMTGMDAAAHAAALESATSDAAIAALVDSLVADDDSAREEVVQDSLANPHEAP